MKTVIGTKKILLELEKKEKKRRIAALIYCIPFICALLMLLLFLLPIIRFTNFNNELTESTSVFRSIFNNTKLAREVLFSQNSQKDAVYMAFSRFVLISALVSLALFVIGALSSLAYMLTGLSFLKDRNEKINRRRLFLTFIPNKATVFILSFLCIAPSVFPKLLSLLIERMLIVYTKTDLTVTIVALAFWLLSIVATIFMRRKTDKEFNIFADSENNDDNEDGDDTPSPLSDDERSKQTKELLKILEENKKK